MSAVDDAAEHEEVTLGYQTPVTVERARRELAAAEVRDEGAVTIKLLIGAPLCLLAPFLIASLLKGVEAKWEGDVLPSFAVTFCAAVVLLVPVLMWVSRRHSGDPYAEAYAGETDPGRPASYGEWEMRNTRAVTLAYAAFATLGPRLLWEAVDHLRGRAAVKPIVRAAAAEVVVQLFDAGEGVPLRDVYRPGRPGGVTAAAIRYLEKLDWVGISSRRDRIWLATAARERLLPG